MTPSSRSSAVTQVPSSMKSGKLLTTQRPFMTSMFIIKSNLYPNRRNCGLQNTRGAGWTTSTISLGEGLRAVGNTDGTISVYKGMGGECCAFVTAHDGGVRALRAAEATVAGSGTGGLLLSGGGDGAVRAWRASAGEGEAGSGLKLEQVGEFVGNGMPIVSIGEAHRASGKIRFLVGDSAGTVYVLVGHFLRDNFE